MIDELYSRKYNAKTYNCAHFAVEVWGMLKGEDVSSAFEGFLLPVKDRFTKPSVRGGFEKLDFPRSPCIVLMKRKKTAPHVGVFIDGRVLHIRKEGVEYQPLDIATMGFNRVNFYDVKNCHAN